MPCAASNELAPPPTLPAPACSAHFYLTPPSPAPPIMRLMLWCYHASKKYARVIMNDENGASESRPSRPKTLKVPTASPEPDTISNFSTCSTDLDENEIRRQLLADKWRQLFDKYDSEGFGEIPWDDFIEVLKTPDFINAITPNKRDILLDRALERKTTAITFQDFVNIVSIFPRP
ncbi:hypothetical protein M8J76_000696 [Diaphorina citri]|nr:hypothetical protein M8J75_005123 [Diaphorina citri]KAI5723059.1 hypothetical protein M8J76_000696 [Diaphorina citri]